MPQPIDDNIHEMPLNDLADPSALRLLDEWRKAERGRLCPAYSSFDILEHPKLAPSLIVLKKGASGSIEKVSYVGGNIVPLAGAEFTGKSFEDFLPNKSHVSFLRDIFGEMAANGKARCWRENLFWQDRDHVSFDVLGLPYEDEEGSVAIIILVFTLHQ